MPNIFKVTKKLDDFWNEYTRNLNPEIYPVDLSPQCYDNKQKVLTEVHQYVDSFFLGGDHRQREQVHRSPL
ncbi:hypothetical protein [Limosilactobacillus avistercoris]|uniref:hypothetical protein n=1 Tax=Limosilactobacillus avistercoris TaxID=2762243 RepID=UPI00384A88CF